MRKQRLELTWIGKDERPRLEPRILLEDVEQSYHAAIRNEGDIFDNRLIFGDNLLALKALEEEFLGKVKCVFIDPPYNTGSAFEHYDDGVEHSIWLSLMRDRLEIIHNLMAEDGSLWITIDDNEAHYLKVICDEIFGRKNFLASISWRSTDNSNNDAKTFSTDHNYIIVYSKTDGWLSNKLSGDDSKRGHFKNPDNDPKGPWFDGNPLNSPKPRPNLTFDLVAPNGNVIKPPKNGWRWSKETIIDKIATGEIRFTKDGRNIRRRTYLADMKGLPPSTLWADLEETGHNRQAKYELKNLFPDRNPSALFPTPKPEKLISKILDIATNENDLVLDSFSGSGTTGAVAHKMGRRWIMVELELSNCSKFIIPRLNRVIDDKDKGGITEAFDWQGGGGFRYYRLAPSLLEKDRFGNWIIAKQYNAAMLAEAVCKLMGFTYAPSQEPENYWRHGHSTEMDFIYVTTQSLTHDALKKLADEVGPGRTLLVCCKAFNAREAAFLNLTIKKIPHTVLSKCEWGRDDYSLSVSNLPVAEAVESNLANGEDQPADAAPKPRGRQRKVASDEPSLFSDVEGK